MNLESEQLNALNEADRARYSSMEKLFASTGWKYVVALAKANVAEAKERGALASSWPENRIAMGAALAWNSISTLEEQTEAVYEAKALEALTKNATTPFNDELEYE